MNKTVGTVFLIVAKLGSLALQLLSVRLILGWLGAESYGLFFAVQVWSSYLVVLDLGLWIGIQKVIAEAKAAQDEETLGFLIRLQFASTWIISIASVALFVGLGAAYRALFHGAVMPSMELIGLCALTYVGGAYCNACIVVLNAQERFRATAAMSLLQTFLSVIGAIVGTAIFRTPESVAGGMAAGFWLCAAISRQVTGNQKRTGPKWSPEVFQHVWQVAMRGYPHRVASLVGKSADQAVIGVYSPYNLTIYRNSCQIPQVMEDLTVLMVQTTVPQLTRIHKEPKEFAGLIHRNGLIATGAACCLILIPAAFGRSLLHLWLKWDFELAGTILFLMAIYRVLDTMLTSMASAFYAAGQLQRLIPFSSFNALVTAGGTIPAYRMGGLRGVAMLNVGIGLLQAFFVFFQVRALVGPDFRIGKLMAPAATTAGLSLVLAAALHWEVDCRLLVHHEWAALILLPMCSIGLAVFLLGTRLCPPPGPIERRFSRLFPRPPEGPSSEVPVDLDQELSEEALAESELSGRL